MGLVPLRYLNYVCQLAWNEIMRVTHCGTKNKIKIHCGSMFLYAFNFLYDAGVGDF